MESDPTQSDQGYPEEQPEEVAPDSGHRPPKEGDGEGRDEKTESGDGKATGNPRSAG